MSEGLTTGEMLRNLRLKKGLTQQGVSMDMGVNVRTYRRWENNESTMSVDSFIRLLNIFGMKVDVVNTKEIKKGNYIPTWNARNY
jgi:transcriptional regulator with XRE-family HTH domain